MKRSIFFLLSALVLCCGTACVKTISERDFNFGISAKPVIPYGEKVLVTVQATPDSPSKGYEYEIRIDNKAVKVEGLGEQFTFEEQNRRVLDLTSLVTQAGHHKISVWLHYSQWKGADCNIDLRQDVVSITGVESSYDVVCTDDLTVKPVVTPEDNTDTLRYKLTEQKGDFILVKQNADGTYTFGTEHRKPGSAVVVWSTHKVTQSMTLNFDYVKITEIKGLEDKYYVSKGDTITLKPVITPDDPQHIEPLNVKCTSTTGDGITIEPQDDGSYKFYTNHGGRSTDVIVFSGENVSETTTIYFYEPATTMGAGQSSFESECDETVDIDLYYMGGQGGGIECDEPVYCELLNVQGGEVTLTETLTETGHRHYKVNVSTAEPASCDVRFYAKNVSEQVSVLFYKSVTMTVNEWVKRRFDIMLSYPAVPTSWKIQPEFTFGSYEKDGKIYVLYYRDGIGNAPETLIGTFTKENDDAPMSFTAEGDNQVFYYNDVATTYYNLVTGKDDYFPKSPGMEMAIFIASTNKYYRLTLADGNVKKVGIYKNSTGDEPVPVADACHYCNYWPFSKTEGTKSKGTIEYFVSEKDYPGISRIKF